MKFRTEQIEYANMKRKGYGSKSKKGSKSRRKVKRYGFGRTVASLLFLLVLSVWAANGVDVELPPDFGWTHGITHQLDGNSDSYSKSLIDESPELIPEYSGEDFVTLNGGVPMFNEYDMVHISGESFSELDLLGRCGTAVAMITRSMMPTEKRGSIGSVKPSGWVQAKYPGVVESEPPYLYNRCHLIAFALTGQNANPKNLITGTRHFNATVMLPFEKTVMECLEDTENSVLYRVSPYFQGNELVARGVEMEAYSVEDEGASVCFHIFCYNVQPGVEIDYSTGESWLLENMR